MKNKMPKWERDLQTLRLKHGRDRSAAQRSFMPNLSTAKPGVAECTNGICKITDQRYIRELPDGAKEFPTSYLHKQGYQLITRDDVKHLSSKK